MDNKGNIQAKPEPVDPSAVEHNPRRRWRRARRTRKISDFADIQGFLCTKILNMIYQDRFDV
ncbi:MAG: hypothetical protein P8090_18930, partial [Gammaproteobacteria bacterium]